MDEGLPVFLLAGLIPLATALIGFVIGRVSSTTQHAVVCANCKGWEGAFHQMKSAHEQLRIAFNSMKGSYEQAKAIAEQNAQTARAAQQTATEALALNDGLLSRIEALSAP